MKLKAVLLLALLIAPVLANAQIVALEQSVTSTDAVYRFEFDTSNSLHDATETIKIPCDGFSQFAVQVLSVTPTLVTSGNSDYKFDIDAIVWPVPSSADLSADSPSSLGSTTSSSITTRGIQYRPCGGAKYLIVDVSQAASVSGAKEDLVIRFRK